MFHEAIQKNKAARFLLRHCVCTLTIENTKNNYSDCWPTNEQTPASISKSAVPCVQLIHTA